MFEASLASSASIPKNTHKKIAHRTARLAASSLAATRHSVSTVGHARYLSPHTVYIFMSSSSQASSKAVLLLLLLLLLHSFASVLDKLNSRPANGSSKNWDGLRISHDVFDSSAVLRPEKLDP